jgi:mannose-6-phosphate isomerase-like protein (cupin superfamily)
MTHEIKNLRDVDDAAVKGGFSETQEAHFATKDLGAEDTGFSYHVVRSGKRQAFAHRHDEAEEVYVVISGTGRVKVDDDVSDIRPLDAIRVAPTAVRAFEAGPDADLELLAFGPRHEGDGELITEPFWDD